MSSHKGVNGTMHIDADAVTFTREGLAARNAFGKGAPARRIPLSEITGIVHKPAGVVTGGHLQLLRNGRSEPSLPAAKDPDGLQFNSSKTAELTPVIAWLRTVAEANSRAVDAPVVTAAAAGGSTRVVTDPAATQWWQKRGAQLAGVGLLGVLLGSCGAGDDSSDELNALRADNASSEERVSSLTEERDRLRTDAIEIREENEALQAQVTAAAAAAAELEPEPEPEPEAAEVAPAPAPVEEAPAPVAEPEPEPEAAYYANCDAVRAAGADPIRQGQPGYRSGLDRDGDGTACDK